MKETQKNMIHNNAVCFIIDDLEYMYQILKGNSEQKALALKNMRVAAELRDQRNIIGPMSSDFTMSVGQKTRMVHNANNRRLTLMDLPGLLVRREGENDTQQDPDVNNVYNFAGVTYDFYKDLFSRNSIDGNYMPIVLTVHYDRGFDNAFWNGLQMVFGDGGGKSAWNTPANFLDIIGHELTHGVINKTANLQYRRQSGALNEVYC